MAKEKPVSSIRMVDVDKIEDDKINTRQEFSNLDLFVLSDSMKDNTQLHPIILNEIDGKLHLISGERRLRAAVIGKILQIEARVFQGLSKIQAAKMMLAENSDRKQLNVIEQALSYKYIFELGVKIPQIAKAEHCSSDTIDRRMKLLKLAPKVQEIMTRVNNPLPVHQALLLLKLPFDDQITVANKAAPASGYVLSEDEVRILIEDILQPRLPIEKPPKDKAEKPAAMDIGVQIIAKIEETKDGFMMFKKPKLQLSTEYTHDKELDAVTIDSDDIVLILKDEDYYKVSELIANTQKFLDKKNTTGKSAKSKKKSAKKCVGKKSPAKKSAKKKMKKKAKKSSSKKKAGKATKR